MRNTLKFLALAAALLPGIALGQSPQYPKNLPDRSVVGRLGSGTGSGPSEAILFSQLGPQLITNYLVVTAPLSISGLNLSITGAAGKVLGGAGSTFTATPTLGVASTTSGTLTLANSGNSGTVTIGAASTATTWTFKFPTTAGSNGQSLITDGSGNTSWAAGTGTVNSGTAGQLTYYPSTAAAVSGNANLNVSSGTLTIGQAGSVLGGVALAGSTSGTTTIIPNVSASGTLTLPAATDTLVGKATTDTLTNKTLTSPAINTPTVTAGTLAAITGFGLRDTSAAFDVTLAATSTSAALTAGRTLTLDMGNVAHTVQFGTTANTITFPSVASDTVTMLAATQSVSNKTITASTYNGLTVTSSTGTLTITNGKTLAVSNSLTFTGTDTNSFAFPSGSDTVVTLAASQTLTNKTLTAPTINGGTAQALTNLGIRSTGTGAFDLVLANTENLTAQRTLTVTLNNAARAINISGNITTAADLITAGANALTLTTTGTTNVTFPTSGTLATTNTSQTFSGSNIFSALTQFTDLKFSSGKLYPTADSTSAEQFCKADGTTCFVTVDTTNQALTAATLKFTTLDATSLGSSTSTVTGLTVNNSPNASNDYIPYYSASDGKIRKATVGSIASGATAGVSSLNGLTGGLSNVSGGGLVVSAASTTITLTSAIPQPGGRLTVQTGTPVMTTTQSAKTTLYYDSYNSNAVPYYTGTIDALDTIGSNEVSTAMAASSTGVLNSGGVFDVWWEGNTNHNICVATNGSGGGWASDTAGSNTARGTGYSQLDRTSRPYVTNKNSVASCYNGATNYGSIAANKLTYLGTITTSAAGQVSWTLGGSASGGTAAVLGIWNMYNRVMIGTSVTDTGVSYTYTSATVRQARASAGNQIQFVLGLSEDSVSAGIFGETLTSSTSGSFGSVGLGFDTTSAFSLSRTLCFTPAAAALICDVQQWNPWTGIVGLHTLSANEASDGTHATTFDTSSFNYLSAQIRM